MTKQAWLQRVCSAISCAAMAGASLLLPTASHAQVAVGDGGTPTYSQAISVPPGVGGMSPKLSLLYAGGGVNGPLGYGWSVQGLSVITRCGQTQAQDGRRAGVTYAASDKLCLDGQRLIQTDDSGSPLATQLNDAQGLGPGLYREFRTEKDIYARIRAYGYANGDSSGASGPTYFMVWTKAGQIYEYGERTPTTSAVRALISPPGKAAMAWAVSRISDTLGNAIDFKYEQRDIPWGSGPTAGSPTPGHEWNILEVQYSGNKVIFNYDLDAQGNDARADKSEAYQQGIKNVSLRRLKSITTYVNSAANALGANGGTPVRTVQLTYDYGTATGRSRITRIQECAGGPSSARCMPATVMAYSPGGSDAYQPNPNFSSSALAKLDLLLSGTTGTMTGDFDGDGKTDIIVWSDTPSENKLYTSNGDGSFTLASAFNIKSDNLFKSDGCYYAIAADFNGDGITDILRVMRAKSATDASVSCGTTITNYLFLGQSNGSFTRVALPSGIDFTQQTSVYTGQQNAGTALSPGASYHLLDVNGDGYLDIVTTKLPGFSRTYSIPSEAAQCAQIVCTRVYLGNSAGQFTELTTTNLTHHSVHANPPKSYDYFRKQYVSDANGDGLADLLVGTGLWFSLGDGNFINPLANSFYMGCANSIDFNGDGRADCLNISPVTNASTLVVGDGTYAANSVAGFNLTNSGQELFATINGLQSTGTVIIDINGDGRQDILRWKDDPNQNTLYLSNGDGTFSVSTTFNLAGTQLQKSDGSASVVVGDFTGRGNAEFLRLRTSGGVGDNQLLVKSDSTPPDQLMSVTGPSGLTTNLYYVPLSNSKPANGVSDASLGARYRSDLAAGVFGANGNSVPDSVNVTTPMYVVATQVDDSGVGSTRLITELSYVGLKADRKGRGMLGFREVLRQRVGADGSPLTVDTFYAQVHPYTGVATSTSTYQSKLNAMSSANLLSSTSNVYCDQTNAGAASSTVNCPVTSKIARPYLYMSTESGRDLLGTQLPTVVTQNVFNGVGDPSTITVTTTGAAAGVSQSFTKVVNNTYYADITSCSDFQTCRWIVGRLNQATVTNTVPNSLASIASSAGTSTNATAIAGSGPAVSSPLNFTLGGCTTTSPTLSPTPATYTCQLGNSGTTSASNLSYATSSGKLVVSGPSSCAANTPNCGNVVMQTSATAGVYSGYFTVSSAGATASSTNVTLTVNAPAGLGVTSASFSPATITAGTSSTFTWSTNGASSANVVCTGTGVSVTGVSNGTAGNVTVLTTAATTAASCTVTAFNAGGASVSGSADLTLNPAGSVGVASAAFSPTTVTVGGSSSFTWSTVNAASASVACSGAGTSATGSGLTGTITVATTSVGTATCQVTARDASNNTAVRSADLTVTAAGGAPVISTKVFDAANVTAGGTSKFTWTVSNATSSSVNCTGAVTGSATGTATGGTVTASAGSSAGLGTCTVTATGPGGTANGAGTINVVLAPTVTAAAFNPTSVGVGGSSTFNWSTANATSASVVCSGAGTTATGSGTSGPLTVSTSSAGTATCTVTASNAAGTTATGSATLSVSPAAPTITTTRNQQYVTAGVAQQGVFSWSASGTATSVSAACSGAGNQSGSYSSGSSLVNGIYVAGSTAGVTLVCTATASNAQGVTTSSSQTFDVIAPPSVPSATWSAAPISVGGQSTLTWSSTNAVSMGISCSGVTGSWSSPMGLNAASGNSTFTASSAGTQTCTLTATNAAGSTATRQVSLDVLAVPTVTSASWSAAPITVGGQSTLTWSSTNASSMGISCSGVTGSWSSPMGLVPTSSSSTFTATSTGTQTCTLTATNAAGSTATRQVSLDVLAPPTVPSATWSSPTITIGGQSTLSWSSSNAVSMGISCAGTTGTWSPPVGLNAPSGNSTFTPTSTGSQVCTLTATNAAGSTAVGQATLTVQPRLFTVSGPSGGTWTFTNPNPGPQVITGISLAFGPDGNPMNAFISGGTCTVGGTVAAGSSCTIMVNAPASSCYGTNYSVAAVLSTAVGLVTGEFINRIAPIDNQCQ